MEADKLQYTIRNKQKAQDALERKTARETKDSMWKAKAEHEHQHAAKEFAQTQAYRAKKT